MNPRRTRRIGARVPATRIWPGSSAHPRQRVRSAAERHEREKNKQRKAGLPYQQQGEAPTDPRDGAAGTGRRGGVAAAGGRSAGQGWRRARRPGLGWWSFIRGRRGKGREGKGRVARDPTGIRFQTRGVHFFPPPSKPVSNIFFSMVNSYKAV